MEQIWAQDPAENLEIQELYREELGIANFCNHTLLVANLNSEVRIENIFFKFNGQSVGLIIKIDR